MPVDFKDSGTNVFDLTLEEPKRDNIDLGELKITEEEFEKMQGAVNYLLRKRYSYFPEKAYYLKVLFGERINLGKEGAKFTQALMKTEIMNPRGRDVLLPYAIGHFKILYPDEFNNFAKRLKPEMMERGFVGFLSAEIIERFRLAFPSRFEQITFSPDQIAQMYAYTSQATILRARNAARLRICFPERDISNSISQKDIETLEQFFKKNKESTLWEPALEDAYLLYILTAKSITVDEDGLHVNNSSANMHPEEQTTPIPEVRSF